MDRVIIEQKLDSMRRCMERIQSKEPLTLDVLQTNYDVQDVIALNLMRAVQLAVDIAAHIVSSQQKPAPQTMGETFALLSEMGVISVELSHRLRKSVGFRNIAVHNYSTVNWGVVYAIVQSHLQDFHAFAKSVHAYLSAF